MLLTSAAVADTTVENVRIWSENNKTRVVLDLSEPVDHNIFTLRGPDRLVIRDRPVAPARRGIRLIGVEPPGKLR